MSSSPEPKAADNARQSAQAETRRFARRLLLAMGALAGLATLGAALVARAHLARVQDAEAGLRFTAAFAGERALQSLRASALADRARVLATRPRIHAALEDDALDLLYLAAHDDLRDTLADPADASAAATPGLRARFYRFADATGQLVPPPADIPTGAATPAELAAAARLAAASRENPARAWLLDATGHSTELRAQPLFSNSDGARIGLLVLGYDEAPPPPHTSAEGLPGRWTADGLHAPGLPAVLREPAARALAPVFAAGTPDGRLPLRLGAADWLVFHRREAGLADAPAERSLWFVPLDALARRQHAATWRIVAAGALLALGGLAAASLFSARFGGWFGRMAKAEQLQREKRTEAESRLALTAAERDRAARFSADASHQLKTPVAVLSLGLDELAADPAFPVARLGDVDELRRQTERLAHIIDDLLLLARLDAGIVRATNEPIDLAALAAAALDDINALPEGETLRLLDEIDAPLPVRGDRRLLGLVLQNLAENAAKYNRPGGLVRLRARTDDDAVRLHVENTAPRPVPASARERIFERFQRGEAEAEKPGHGLGLNLARDLARLHGGDLDLDRSDTELTVFTLTLPRA